MMRRREFITLFGGTAIAWPLAAHAQQPPKAARIRYLSAASAPDANIESVRQGMLNIGYIEGRDFVIEARYAERDYSLYPKTSENVFLSMLHPCCMEPPTLVDTH
jgi:putative tryptophan/tyrosine transport system substrate-binding protein